ncbi:MAG: outer membrane protein assembly factor BamE [Gammaproteobacteria bacterium]|jgi:outer membrane protein assembly factor BamE|nr:outer membrane protein assembly factor BamE [Gammaproteobacteria bacterium]MDP6615727.1 outer membrane protein assembly factor BamE [Gammaproteobacteria bacterium]MDP6695262.1 outer membrane protein assembly factor BamE [Gammaproteobacteria bacterium]
MPSIQHTTWLNLFAAFLLCAASACVYEIDVQQGNKLEPKDIEAVKVGMTRNQVRFLLGTPVVSDPFRNDRWDYVYYFRAGRSDDPERRWLIVWFDDNIVTKIDRDAQVKPS